MIRHMQSDTALIVDAATRVVDSYCLKQIPTIAKPQFHPLLCPFLIKI